MSVLTRTSTTMLRSLRFAPRAPFSTSLRAQKSAVDSAKDALKAVDRTVADVAVKGIEKGEKVSAATKEAIGVTSSKAEDSAKETAGEARGTASKMAGEAKGTASEVASSASSKAAELSGKAKGKASEVAGKTKGNVAEIKAEAKAKANEF